MIAGEIGKPHGIHGDVYVVVISDDPRRFEPGSSLLHADGRTLTVEHGRAHRDRFLVKFEGIESREAAEGLRGTLYVPASDARELERDEFWEHDLIGCGVFDTIGQPLGSVIAVVPGTAHDLLEVETARGTGLVPFVSDIVRETDPAARRVVIDPPEGLLP